MQHNQKHLFYVVSYSILIYIFKFIVMIKN